LPQKTVRKADQTTFLNRLLEQLGCGKHSLLYTTITWVGVKILQG
jgi:hypothetical protein